MSNSAIRAGRAFVEIGVRNKMERGLNAASKRLRSFAGSLSGIGKSIGTVGAKMAAPIALAGAIFANFDAKMAAVKAITNSTDEQMQRLRATAKELGASTQFSASQAAEAMQYLGMAGYNTEQILAGIPAVLNLAAAGGIDLAMAADIATDVASAFGLTADEITRVADVMAATATSANTNIEMMGETFKYLAPLAAAAGQEIEQAGAAVGIVANSGVKASMAGTDLALIMKTLANPAAQKQLTKMGVSVVDAEGNVRDLTDIIRDLAGATAGMAEAEKLAFFEGMFGRAAKSALILTGSTGDFDKLADKLENAGGSAERMAKTMADSAMGDFVSLLSAAEGIAIQVGEAIATPMRQAMQEVTRILRATTEWMAANQGIVVGIVGIVAALLIVGALLIGLAVPIAAVGLMLSGMATAIGAVAGAASMIGAAFGAIVSPVGLALAAIVAIGGAILYYTGAGSAAVDMLRGTWASLASEVGNVAKGIMAALGNGDLESVGEIVSRSLVLYWNAAIAEMKKSWISWSTWAVNTFDAIFTGLMDGTLITSIVDKLGRALSAVMNKIIDTFTTVFAKVIEWLGYSAEAITAAIADVTGMAPDAAPTLYGRTEDRNAKAAARIAEIDAEIAALRAARDESIDSAIAAAETAAAEAAADATQQAMDRAKNAAGAAAGALNASALEMGTFSAVAAERSYRSNGGVADAFKQVGMDIVDAVNGTTDAINNQEGLAFGAS